VAIDSIRTYQYGRYRHSFDRAGIDRLVLFNRFYQPDLDLQGAGRVSHRVLLQHRAGFAATAALDEAPCMAARSGESGGDRCIHEGVDARSRHFGQRQRGNADPHCSRTGSITYRYVEAKCGWMEANEYASIDELSAASPVQVRRDSPGDRIGHNICGR